MKKSLNILKSKQILQTWYCAKIYVLVVLFFCIMFVAQNNCREIYNDNFINNKELPTGNKFERLVYLTLQLFCNPTGDSAYKNIFDMQNENPIVDVSVYARFTQLQNFLVNNHINLKKEKNFIKLYYVTLPFSKSQEDCFLAVNQLHYNRHKSYKFKSYKSFKTSENG